MPAFTEEEAKALKGKGFILCRDGEHFAARIVTENGVLTSARLRALAEAAERYGNGTAALTQRCSAEIQGIPYENIAPLCAYLAQYELYPGGTGPRVRPIVACKGTVCPHGLIDTQGWAKELYERFYLGWRDVKLPGKFKIGVGGCPNNCVKPSIDDVGLMGQSVPRFDASKCRGCASCAVAGKCPMKICAKDADGKITHNADECVRCGVCTQSCPFGAVTEEAHGCLMTVGGIWGRRQRIGTPLPGIYGKEEAFDLIERILHVWSAEARPGERLGRYIDRVGFEAFVKKIQA